MQGPQSAADLVSSNLHLARKAVMRIKGWMDRELLAVAYLALALAASEFDHSRGTDFEAYVACKIRFALIDRLRYEQRRNHGPLGEYPAPEKSIEQALRIDIERAIEQLPSRQRQILRLRYWDGLTMAEAAREAGVSVHAAKLAQRAAIASMRIGLA